MQHNVLLIYCIHSKMLFMISKSETLSIRLSKQAREAAERLAAAQGRSLGNLVERLLLEAEAVEFKKPRVRAMVKDKNA
jgi:hypothetical protein